MTERELETQVREGLSADEPVDQSEFVESFSRGSNLEEQHVLSALRNLMERDKVSYTIDYNLQTEDKL